LAGLIQKSLRDAKQGRRIGLDGCRGAPFQSPEQARSAVRNARPAYCGQHQRRFSSLGALEARRLLFDLAALSASAFG